MKSTPAYKSQPAPRRVSQGTVARPVRKPKPRLGTLPKDAAPRFVKNSVQGKGFRKTL